MHELSLMQAALSIALDRTNAEGASTIHSLELHVGKMSGVVPEALLFAFDVVSEGTAAEGAELTLKTIPTRCYCTACQQEFQPADWVYECPRCRRISTNIRQGQDLTLVSLEVS